MQPGGRPAIDQVARVAPIIEQRAPRGTVVLVMDSNGGIVDYDEYMGLYWRLRSDGWIPEISPSFAPEVDPTAAITGGRPEVGAQHRQERCSGVRHGPTPTSGDLRPIHRGRAGRPSPGWCRPIGPRNLGCMEPVVITEPGVPGPVDAPVTTSAADRTMRRLLRIPDGRNRVDEAGMHRIFGTSILLSATRCLLSYVLLPIVLPVIGVASGVGPVLGIVVGVLALVFDVKGIRRFWLADHRQKWAFSALYLVVGCMVAALVVTDIVHLAT